MYSAHMVSLLGKVRHTINTRTLPNDAIRPSNAFAMSFWIARVLLLIAGYYA
jgi:hypothetical protein